MEERQLDMLEVGGSKPSPPTPRWVWLTLLAGTLALMVWGWVLTLFHAESSVVEAAEAGKAKYL